ncbi:hypothetical protein [Undibacterium fentianense]|uniref:Uncharacterized protein n=1 Tax=Undibacterium fentianense TaxID=2828728 RepID=A0A941E1S4_9BURK|nr:hypothetical protein [Undibacterium fentianense]MBR7799482.1 hypothetical protein [Undibacterium fentianense]
MNIVLNELKIKATFLHKKIELDDQTTLTLIKKLSRQRRWPVPEQWQHKHCLNLIAAKYGFHDWQHAHHIFSGLAKIGEDMGDFWQENLGFINHWFASYQEALDYLAQDKNAYLLPYRQQFMVVKSEYLEALHFQPNHICWLQFERNLCSAYGSDSWLELALYRLKQLG